MLQLLVIFAISWLVLWFFQKKNLGVLGLMPNRIRLKQALLFFVLSATISAFGFLLKIYLAKETYRVATNLDLSAVLTSCWFQFRSVLTEELLCRGAFLYLLFMKFGKAKAITTSAIFFALLHVMERSVWNNPVQMLLLLSFTFLMGLVLAYAFVKTMSLYIPCAIHFGWNIVQNFVFDDTATGSSIFLLSAPPPEVTISYVSFFILLFLPKILVLGLNYLLLKKLKPVQ